MEFETSGFRKKVSKEKQLKFLDKNIILFI